MCILCEMKDAGASDEVIELAKKLTEKLADSLAIHAEICELYPKSYTDEVRNKLQACADLLNDSLSGIQGVSMYVMRQGETIKEFIARVYAERTAPSDKGAPPDVTKH